MIGSDAAYYARVARFAASAKYRAEAEALLGALGLAPRARVLDLGCGTGALLGLLLERGFAAVGLDAHDAWREHAPLAPALRGDAAWLPFAAGVFDAVVMMHVLAHLATPSVALDEVRRVLAPAGRLGLITPNRRFLATLGGLPRALNRYAPDPTVERHFELGELATLLAGSGFETVRAEPLGKLPWPCPTPARRERLLLVARLRA